MRYCRFETECGASFGRVERIGKEAPIAVLPEGPMTIPYLN